MGNIYWLPQCIVRPVICNGSSVDLYRMNPLASYVVQK